MIPGTVVCPSLSSKNNVIIVQKLFWSDKLGHLRNFIDRNCTNAASFISKNSKFIGYVNKFRGHVCYLQLNVTIK